MKIKIRHLLYASLFLVSACYLFHFSGLGYTLLPIKGKIWVTKGVILNGTQIINCINQYQCDYGFPPSSLDLIEPNESYRSVFILGRGTVPFEYRLNRRSLWRMATSSIPDSFSSPILKLITTLNGEILYTDGDFKCKPGIRDVETLMKEYPNLKRMSDEFEWELYVEIRTLLFDVDRLYYSSLGIYEEAETITKVGDWAFITD